MEINTSAVLNNIADELDIADSLYEKAVKSYEAVGKWLDSQAQRFKPDIYPQGSFRLGTVVKPITENDHYDIDLVCTLNIASNVIKPKDLKAMVGNWLGQHETYKKMMQPEGRRCWTLDYADSARFHMDILPAIPEAGYLPFIGVSDEWRKTSINITDRTHINDWLPSNPKGYALWFESRQASVYRSLLEKYAMLKNAKVEDVPAVSKYRIKTPLRQAIKILKRHRDIRFKDKDGKPISMILTTLAATAYNGEADLYQALQGILSRMHAGIHIDKFGRDVIGNPVNPTENFADKWAESPELKTNFYEWLKQARQDFQQLGLVKFHEFPSRLENQLGKKPVTAAIQRITETFKENRSSLKVGAAGVLGVSAGISAPAHTFYGEMD